MIATRSAQPGPGGAVPLSVAQRSLSDDRHHPRRRRRVQRLALAASSPTPGPSWPTFGLVEGDIDPIVAVQDTWRWPEIRFRLKLTSEPRSSWVRAE